MTTLGLCQLLSQNPLHQVLDLLLIVRRSGLHNLVLFFMTIWEFGLFTGSDVFDQALFSISFAFVFGCNLVVTGAIFVLINTVASETIVLFGEGFCRIGICCIYIGRETKCGKSDDEKDFWTQRIMLDKRALNEKVG